MDTALTSGGVDYSGMTLFWCGVVGLGVTAALIVITEYYTGYQLPARAGYCEILCYWPWDQCDPGPGGFDGSTALPAIVICVGIILTYLMAGLFGIAVAVSTMLSLAGMIVALDAFGPVTDNAGGIAEMSGLEGDVRKTTDALDACGQHHQSCHQGLCNWFELALAHSCCLPHIPRT